MVENKNCYKIEDLNENIEDIKQIIKESEKRYFTQIDETVNMVLKNNIKMILVSGPSASGKTTSSSFISQGLLKHGIGSMVVSIDDFFIDLKDTPVLEDGMPDFENIKCVDIKAFNKFCNTLLKKQKAKMPRYDFIKHKRGCWEKVEVSKDDVLIVEGIHALNPLLLKKSKFNKQALKVYICVDSVFSYKNKVVISERELRLMRRSHRDAFTRNHTPERTFNQWKHVCSGEDVYITPYRQFADIVIDTTRNYEVMIYANYIPDLLKPYKDNPMIKHFLTKFNHIKTLDKKFVPKKSLLWEFLVEKE